MKQEEGGEVRQTEVSVETPGCLVWAVEWAEATFVEMGNIKKLGLEMFGLRYIEHRIYIWKCQMSI